MAISYIIEPSLSSTIQEESWPSIPRGSSRQTSISWGSRSTASATSPVFTPASSAPASPYGVHLLVPRPHHAVPSAAPSDALITANATSGSPRQQQNARKRSSRSRNSGWQRNEDRNEYCDEELFALLFLQVCTECSWPDIRTALWPFLFPPGAPRRCTTTSTTSVRSTTPADSQNVHLRVHGESTIGPIMSKKDPSLWPVPEQNRKLASTYHDRKTGHECRYYRWRDAWGLADAREAKANGHVRDLEFLPAMMRILRLSKEFRDRLRGLEGELEVQLERVRKLESELGRETADVWKKVRLGSRYRQNLELLGI
ncbi:hypothetical protein K402DRAFT_421112 [Aulographum hederae CBS 113979]|uniref:Uncharacterized protein n=1 Tax=Aulographum hederae CBS 113979 TaxID=1176131 RepID=A0A6G1H0C0_9PEZI|nr:hypothetical protein K402DRAFT_421112 [Aulographum hederae CBS 113979]